jgi:1,4-dihydroxy-6-naphthoate synthase
MLPLSLGYSPCPNDTFMFHAVSSGLLALPGYKISEHIHDVETLNRMAFKEKLDITKMSFYAWLRVKSRYSLLENGAALGYGCGPVLISKHPLKPVDISECCVVLPGKWTTAHLLFQLWSPEAKNKLFVPYNEIFRVLESGEADCGVIIHESRFTFRRAGFHEITDLGAWWEQKTGLPIPLGCIAAKKTISDQIMGKFDNLIYNSIKHAREHPEQSMLYAGKYAQEMEQDVLQKHIETFVNKFSLGLGHTGRAAVEKLEKMALHAGVIQ